MSLMKSRQPTFIGLCCAAVLLDLDESTIRKGLCGTENLTQIRRSSPTANQPDSRRSRRAPRQRVSLILEEVVALKAEWINAELERKFSSSGKAKLQLVV